MNNKCCVACKLQDFIEDESTCINPNCSCHTPTEPKQEERPSFLVDDELKASAEKVKKVLEEERESPRTQVARDMEKLKEWFATEFCKSGLCDRKDDKIDKFYLDTYHKLDEITSTYLNKEEL